MSSPDNMNCLKNLLQLMCIDGIIHPKEKEFLQKAAAQLDIAVDDWNALLKEVLHDNIPFYTIVDHQKATAALKAMIVMAQSDGKIDEKERRYVLQFAKSIGVDRTEWKALLAHIEAGNLFGPYQKPQGNLIALTEDFEKLDAFLKVAADYGTSVETIGLNQYLKKEIVPKAVVCFHAAQEKDLTVSRCKLLLGKAGDGLVCILTRFQGHQVKYLHEAGLKKCVIEPVYTRDIIEILKLAAP